eukprot:GHRR01021603.1.p1 GENE.GHRR01021603.1~~GHRR01021603.1.p1  ORF type:complete len:300 (+),score=17.52 GHRR01021603.1:45-944(+)
MNSERDAMHAYALDVSLNTYRQLFTSVALRQIFELLHVRVQATLLPVRRSAFTVATDCLSALCAKGCWVPRPVAYQHLTRASAQYGTRPQGQRCCCNPHVSSQQHALSSTHHAQPCSAGRACLLWMQIVHEAAAGIQEDDHKVVWPGRSFAACVHGAARPSATRLGKHLTNRSHAGSLSSPCSRLLRRSLQCSSASYLTASSTTRFFNSSSNSPSTSGKHCLSLTKMRRPWSPTARSCYFRTFTPRRKSHCLRTGNLTARIKLILHGWPLPTAWPCWPPSHSHGAMLLCSVACTSSAAA